MKMQAFWLRSMLTVGLLSNVILTPSSTHINMHSTPCVHSDGVCPGRIQLLLKGNHGRARPSLGGQQAASSTLRLKGGGQGWGGGSGRRRGGLYIRGGGDECEGDLTRIGQGIEDISLDGRKVREISREESKEGRNETEVTS